MEDATGAELATLRSRAYGPDADIAGDAAALARLRALEASARDADSVSDEPTPEPAPAAVEDAAVADASVEGSSASATSAAPVWTPPRIGRALLIGWAASLVAVAVAVGALVFGLASVRPVSTDVGARQVAALQTRVTDADLGESVAFLDQAIALYRYEGLLVAVLDKGVLDPEKLCLLVAPEGELVGDGGTWFASGCTAGPFRASASIMVGDRSPDGLRAAFADGTALQFVWDGSVVGVFAADPLAPEDVPPRPSVFPMDLGRGDIGP